MASAIGAPHEDSSNDGVPDVSTRNTDDDSTLQSRRLHQGLTAYALPTESKVGYRYESTLTILKDDLPPEMVPEGGLNRISNHSSLSSSRSSTPPPELIKDGGPYGEIYFDMLFEIMTYMDGPGIYFRVSRTWMEVGRHVFKRHVTVTEAELAIGSLQQRNLPFYMGLYTRLMNQVYVNHTIITPIVDLYPEPRTIARTVARIRNRFDKIQITTKLISRMAAHTVRYFDLLPEGAVDEETRGDHWYSEGHLGMHIMFGDEWTEWEKVLSLHKHNIFETLVHFNEMLFDLCYRVTYRPNATSIRPVFNRPTLPVIEFGQLQPCFDWHRGNRFEAENPGPPKAKTAKAKPGWYPARQTEEQKNKMDKKQQGKQTRAVKRDAAVGRSVRDYLAQSSAGYTPHSVTTPKVTVAPGSIGSVIASSSAVAGSQISPTASSGNEPTRISVGCQPSNTLEEQVESIDLKWMKDFAQMEGFLKNYTPNTWADYEFYRIVLEFYQRVVLTQEDYIPWDYRRVKGFGKFQNMAMRDTILRFKVDEQPSFFTRIGEAIYGTCTRRFGRYNPGNPVPNISPGVDSDGRIETQVDDFRRQLDLVIQQLVYGKCATLTCDNTIETRVANISRTIAAILRVLQHDERYKYIPNLHLYVDARVREVVHSMEPTPEHIAQRHRDEHNAQTCRMLATLENESVFQTKSKMKANNMATARKLRQAEVVQANGVQATVIHLIEELADSIDLSTVIGSLVTLTVAYTANKTIEALLEVAVIKCPLLTPFHPFAAAFSKYCIIQPLYEEQIRETYMQKSPLAAGAYLAATEILRPTNGNSAMWLLGGITRASIQFGLKGSYRHRVGVHASANLLGLVAGSVVNNRLDNTYTLSFGNNLTGNAVALLRGAFVFLVMRRLVRMRRARLDGFQNNCDPLNSQGGSDLANEPPGEDGLQWSGSNPTHSILNWELLTQHQNGDICCLHNKISQSCLMDTMFGRTPQGQVKSSLFAGQHWHGGKSPPNMNW